jgi:heme oxygenase (biliverdin-IX-beta and delta-forming)
MRRPNDLRDRLRLSTRQDHARVDGLLSTLNLADPPDYVRFLAIHAEALSELGNRTSLSDRADAAALMACLETDLEFYGARQTRVVAARTHDSLACQLGISYVIRGSRLGAEVLARRIAVGAPSAYLSYRPTTTWGNFVQSLEAFSLTQPPENEQEVIAGAKVAFGVFLLAAQPAGSTS